MTVIGTWNMENLFRPGGGFGPRDDGTYTTKIHRLASTIGQAGLDVVAVQEIGDPAALNDVAALLEGNWQVATSMIFQATHPIRVGFLSRLPMKPLADVAAFPDLMQPVQADDTGGTVKEMGRGALAVQIHEESGKELAVVACHLKSKLLSFPGPHGTSRFSPHDEGERARFGAYALNRRAAEAVTVRALADQLLAGQGTTRQVIIAGDLNDTQQAATTEILLGPPGSELGTPGYARPDKGDPVRLWNLAPLLPEGEQYTRICEGRKELIDHLLVSQALLGRITEVHTVHPTTVPSVTGHPAARRDKAASDHALLYAQLSG